MGQRTSDEPASLSDDPLFHPASFLSWVQTCSPVSSVCNRSWPARDWASGRRVSESSPPKHPSSPKASHGGVTKDEQEGRQQTGRQERNRSGAAAPPRRAARGEPGSNWNGSIFSRRLPASAWRAVNQSFGLPIPRQALNQRNRRRLRHGSKFMIRIRTLAPRASCVLDTPASASFKRFPLALALAREHSTTTLGLCMLHAASLLHVSPILIVSPFFFFNRTGPGPAD